MKANSEGPANTSRIDVQRHQIIFAHIFKHVLVETTELLATLVMIAPTYDVKFEMHKLVAHKAQFTCIS